ncbi:MAG: hypothetical protein K2F76_03195, partial [Duncaniella dubosii]|nr:hypothetical protein [Duncaniella dubosii]
MKKISILAASAAMSLLAIASSCTNDKTCQQTSSSTDDAIANIMTRTSVRDYTSTPISEATIDTLLRAGMA